MRKTPKILTKEKFQHFMNEGLSDRKNKRLRDATICMLMYECGLRISEIEDLDRNDIDAQRHTIYIKNAKGNKSRYVPIPQSTMLFLKHYMDTVPASEDGALFYSTFNKRDRIKGCCIRATLEKMSEKSGIYLPGGQHVHPHALRHSFATNCLNDGFTIYDVQMLLGHESINTTAIYLHASLAELQKKTRRKVPKWINELRKAM